MPPWRGEGMTGTRASGCPRPAAAGDGAAICASTPDRRRPDPANRSSLLGTPSWDQPLTAPRSFVLAALRALHPDPVGGLIHACHQEGKAGTPNDLLRRDLTVPAPSGLTLEGCVANPGRTCVGDEVRNDPGTVPCEDDLQQPQRTTA